MNLDMPASCSEMLVPLDACLLADGTLGGLAGNPRIEALP